MPVVMLTAHGSERVAVAAMKAGAYDYLPKPFDPDEIVLAMRRAIEARSLRMQNALLRTESALGRPIVAASPAMRRVLDDGGAGRAQGRHRAARRPERRRQGRGGAPRCTPHSRRADKPFVRFNAAAIPTELAEAELFGHTKGAFTGAQAAKLGYFQQARRRHAVHRRDRRAAAGHPGQAAARPAVGRGAAGRRPRREGRRAAGRRHQPRSGRRGRRRGASARTSSTG